MHQNHGAGQNHNIKIAIKSFRNEENVKYLLITYTLTLRARTWGWLSSGIWRRAGWHIYRRSRPRTQWFSHSQSRAPRISQRSDKIWWMLLPFSSKSFCCLSLSLKPEKLNYSKQSFVLLVYGYETVTLRRKGVKLYMYSCIIADHSFRAV
jgi:hypothetical protein